MAGLSSKDLTDIDLTTWSGGYTNTKLFVSPVHDVVGVCHVAQHLSVNVVECASRRDIFSHSAVGLGDFGI